MRDIRTTTAVKPQPVPEFLEARVAAMVAIMPGIFLIEEFFAKTVKSVSLATAYSYRYSLPYALYLKIYFESKVKIPENIFRFRSKSDVKQ